MEIPRILRYSLALVFLLSGRLLFAQQVLHLPTVIHESDEKAESARIEFGEADPIELMYQHWFQRRAYEQEGRYAQAQEEISEIIRLSEISGINRLPRIAGALVKEGYEHLEQQPLTAETNFRLALQLDPNMAQAHFGLARVLLQQRKSAIFSAIHQVTKGLMTYLRDFWSLTTSLIYGLLLIELTLVLTAGVFLLCLGLRYFKNIRHIWMERLKNRVSVRTARFVAAGLVVLPLLIWLDPLVLLVYWAIFLWIYLRGKEKGIVILFVFALLLLFPLVQTSTKLFLFLHEPGPRELIESLNGEFHSDRVNILHRYLVDNPEQPIVRFTLAALYKNGGYYTRAIDLYEELIASGAEVPRSALNLGNIHFIEGDYYRAVNYYQQAINADPDLALAYLNSGIAYGEEFQFAKSEDMLKRARDLDPDLLSWESSDSEHIVLLDAAPSGMDLLHHFVAERERWLPTADWRELFGHRLSWLALIGTVGLVAISFSRFRMARSSTCYQCGLPFCQECQPTLGEIKDHCSQCLHLFVKRDGVAPETRAQKMYQVERYRRSQALRALFISILYPGAWRLYGNRTISAFLFGCLWFGGLIHLFLRPRLWPFSTDFLSGQSLSYSFVMIALVFVWGFGNLGLVRLRARGL